MTNKERIIFRNNKTDEFYKEIANTLLNTPSHLCQNQDYATQVLCVMRHVFEVNRNLATPLTTREVLRLTRPVLLWVQHHMETYLTR